jgi:zinc protease
MRAMTMVLQGRLFDKIRQELGATYSIEADPSTVKFPRPQYTVRIDWTCDPAQTANLVQQVFKEIAFVRDTTLSPDQVNRIRAALQREFEQNSQNNGYLLGQISRRYQDRDATNIASVFEMRQRIAALTGPQIQDAAQTYLNMRDYVKVTLMPERRQ